MHNGVCRLIGSTDGPQGPPPCVFLDNLVKGIGNMPKFNGAFKFAVGNIGTKEKPINGIRLVPGGDKDQENLTQRLRALAAKAKAADKIRVFDPDNRLSKNAIKSVDNILKGLEIAEEGEGYAFVVMQGKLARPAPYLAFLKVAGGPAKPATKAKTANPFGSV